MVKLLLTSNGMDNPTLVRELRELTGRDFADLTVALIPTAATFQDSDKSRFLDDLTRFRDLRWGLFDLVELTALSAAEVRRRLTRADVIVVGGGEAYPLQDWVDHHDIAGYLPGLLEERVYVGISAGSMLATPHLALSSASDLWGELGEGEDPWRPGLGLVDFYVRPHLDDPAFPTSREATIAQVAASLPRRLYAVDEASALRVVDGEVRVVGEGRVLTFDPKGTG